MGGDAAVFIDPPSVFVRCCRAATATAATPTAIIYNTWLKKSLNHMSQQGVIKNVYKC